MEAIVLAGGKAERMGEATGGRPKALVDVAGKPLVAYQIGRLGAEIVCAEESERLGRGGGIKFAARQRAENGEVFAMNGDELVDVDFAALLAGHRETEAAAT